MNFMSISNKNIFCVFRVEALGIYSSKSGKSVLRNFFDIIMGY